MSYFRVSSTMFWNSGDASSAFQNQSGFGLIHITGVNVIHISHYRGECNAHFPRSTSCSTHCQLLKSQHYGSAI